MIPPRPTELAHVILGSAILEGDLAIDATAGNGHDTRFLAECVGNGGKVHAFDIQSQAIATARARVTRAGLESRVEFHETSHANMARHVSAGQAAAVMFNLGYLPGDDHSITTETSGTLAAIEAAILLLAPGGVLSVVCYPGHHAGAIEAENVENRFENLGQHGWRIAKYGVPGTSRPAPFLLIGRKP